MASLQEKESDFGYNLSSRHSFPEMICKSRFNALSNNLRRQWLFDIENDRTIAFKHEYIREKLSERVH